MKTICLYFQVHQPVRLKKYRFFNIGADHHYLDDYSNRTLLQKMAQQCYLPMNNLLLEQIKKHGGQFKVSFSMPGIAIEQFKNYAPEVLESFQALAQTGCVEFLGETYSHSLSSLISVEEFAEQVQKHSKLIEVEFGVTPRAFRNTELIYSDQIGEEVAKLGFGVMLTEGAKHVLGRKSPNYLYTNALNPKLKLLLRNFKLSDDIAIHFSRQSWDQWPLTADKYVSWLENDETEGDIINLFMDYETFGEHQSSESGIFDFMRYLPEQALQGEVLSFTTPSEAAEQLQPYSVLHSPYPISWTDEERDVTAWLGNELQNEAFNTLYRMRTQVKEADQAELNLAWNFLQSSDHFYYMATKWFSDGDGHSYFNPYSSPYDAFVNYMNIVSDFQIEVKKKIGKLKLQSSLI